MDTIASGGWFRPRRLIGIALLLLGVYTLLGGPFVPVQAMVRDPGFAPFPERLVAIWILLVGACTTLWPGGR